MSPRDELFLEHVILAIDAIERYTAAGEKAFFDQALIQDAVIRQLEIVGEAIKNLSADLTARESAVPWKQAARTRDLLIHGYFRVNLDIVWAVVLNELPQLRREVVRIRGQA